MVIGKSQSYGRLKWTYELSVLRFFVGKLKQVGNWQEKLVVKFKKDFEDMS